ncbi:MAG: alpha/beta hydrolase family protein [Bacteroidales bacterium]|nr:alpha/beta hydrolase family protein [Bacteroidales bacterium]
MNKLFSTLTILLASALMLASAQQNITTSVVPVKVQTDTVTVMSKKMNREIKAVVVKPQQYFHNPTDSFPTVYVLHGAWGSYRDWPTKKQLEPIATRYGVVIVCPDGQDSWYLDSPIDPKMQFETFISHELVEYVDTHYPTFRSPKMRAICGLSMGGHGALWNAFRHPEVFGSCGSMSGGVDITKFPNKWKIDLRIGKFETHQDAWAQHAVINLVPALKPGQNIIIDDGYDDFFYEVNCNLHKALLEKKIPHDFIIRPGGHTWDYWVNALDYQMLFFSKAFCK